MMLEYKTVRLCYASEFHRMDWILNEAAQEGWKVLQFVVVERSIFGVFGREKKSQNELSIAHAYFEHNLLWYFSPTTKHIYRFGNWGQLIRHQHIDAWSDQDWHGMEPLVFKPLSSLPDLLAQHLWSRIKDKLTEIEELLIAEAKEQPEQAGAELAHD